VFVTELLELDQYRRSPNLGAGASRPKRVYTSSQGEIFFKFDISKNEICAELFAYALAKKLGIAVADTKLAIADNVLGIASYDIGEYEEPSDDYSYSVKDFLNIGGFVELCLFDYLIMNEDRHAGNWGIVKSKVAPLFDHNYAFGGDTVINDISNFMVKVTTQFYVTNENRQRHDAILLYFIKYHADDVKLFMRKIGKIGEVYDALWERHFPEDCERLNKILQKRIEYMERKVDENSAREIDDNEF